MAGPAMSALTPEQMELPAKMIPGFKGSLFDYLRSHMRAEVRRIDEDGCAFWQGLSGDILADLLAAAESVGKLEERNAQLEYAGEFLGGMVKDGHEVITSLRAQLTAREQERDEARNIARQLFKVHSRCLNKKSVHDYIRFDADADVVASWPPQTTETRG